MAEEFYAVEVAGIQRKLPLMEIKPGVKIAILNILGDYEFVNAASAELAQALADIPIDVLVTAEAKSIPLAHALSSLDAASLRGLAQVSQTLYGGSAAERDA